MYHAAQQMRVQQSLDVHSTAGKSAVSPHSEPAISPPTETRGGAGAASVLRSVSKSRAFWSRCAGNASAISSAMGGSGTSGPAQGRSETSPRADSRGASPQRDTRGSVVAVMNLSVGGSAEPAGRPAPSAWQKLSAGRKMTMRGRAQMIGP